MRMSHLLPDEMIQRVADAHDIVELIGSHMPLKKAGARYVALCPFHQEKTPSFTVSPSRGTFKCFGCGVGGSVYDFLMIHEGMSFPAAVHELAGRAGIPILEESGFGERSSITPLIRTNLPARAKPDAERSVLWPRDLRQGSRKELVAVAIQRGLSLAGVELTSERGLLWVGSPETRPDWRAWPSWVVTDSDRINAQARRMDGTPWAHIGDKKAYTLPGSRASWPIGAREVGAFPFVLLTEGGPDLLAAHHFIVAENRENDVVAVAMLGAANFIPDDALAMLAEKRVRLFPHADCAGQDAAVRWRRQLEGFGAVVDAFRFKGLRRADGEAVNDLNDLANIHPDDFESEQTDLLEVLPR